MKVRIEMAREQDEAVLRITAQYVAEVRAGRQPRVSDLLTRYPQYANEISDFIFYYHALEDHEQREGGEAQEDLSDMSAAAFERVRARGILGPKATKHHLVTTLLVVGRQRLPAEQIASRLDLSEDIVLILERRMIEPTTIPDEVCRRLAAFLDQPAYAVRGYLYGAEERSQVSSERKRVAEDRLQYPLEKLPPALRQSFRRALEESQQLSGEQKERWYEIVQREGL